MFGLFLKLIKLWVRIQRYTAVDFRGWSKMTPKNKAAHITILRGRFRKILLQPFVELHS